LTFAKQLYNTFCEIRDFFMDNPLGHIHLIIEMISVDRPCAMGV